MRHLTRDAVRELLVVMFEGWRLHEASYHPPHGYERDRVECMTEAAGGDRLVGELAHLFSHWSEDVISVAAHYGVGWLADGTFSTDLPPPPSQEHWWTSGEWRPPVDERDGMEDES